MATKYTLTTAFTAITETSGTIQNVGNESVELASSTNAVAGEGIVLNPSEKRSFKGALSARSLGDVGAVVNVVDFTEAGEGGEEYVLPVASDTTLGGIKISNSFTVANDGTLSIKKSGKTILGAVKSSDDEGKVSVNNDGTMTYNPLGYRQPSTAYTAGQIAYHSALPTGWYLECTTAGTSGSGDITPTSTIGSTVTDGTVTWTVRGLPAKFDTFTEQYATDCNDCIKPGVYVCQNTTANVPILNTYPQSGALTTTISLLGSAHYLKQVYLGNSGSVYSFIRTSVDGGATWSPWQQQEAIVAKSLGTNGYIKYASGLIMQWGGYAPSSGFATEHTITVPFNISFATNYHRVVCNHASDSINNHTAVTVLDGGQYSSLDNFTVRLKLLSEASDPAVYGGVIWFAFGY